MEKLLTIIVSIFIVFVFIYAALSDIYSNNDNIMEKTCSPSEFFTSLSYKGKQYVICSSLNGLEIKEIDQ